MDASPVAESKRMESHMIAAMHSPTHCREARDIHPSSTRPIQRDMSTANHAAKHHC